MLPKRESDLVRVFEDILPTFLRQNSRDIKIKNEVGAGRFISDVVALVTTKGIELKSPVLSSRESVVLSCIRQHGPITKEKLHNFCRIAPEQLSRICSKLERAGIIRSQQRLLRLRREWARSTKLIAFEAKLTRWRDALRQATAYRSFADKSYVVLSAPLATTAIKNAKEFRAEGVGLLVVKNGAIRTLISSTPRGNYDWRREYIVSRLIS